MHFEKSLKRTIYPPWNDQYIDYNKLKRLLRDEGSDAGDADDGDEWTDEDEGAFVEELVNVQLEKVNSFQVSTIQKLRDRTSNCESKLDPVVTKRNKKEEESETLELDDSEKTILREVLKELDGISNEMSELEKFSRINYTGFMKATKKHDRKRGRSYRVRPLMQVRLAALPFNKEDYSPLLFRLSTMYSFCRQQLDNKTKIRTVSEGSRLGGDKYTAHKFWVHPENVLEVKTLIMRRLPVLVYNPQTSKIAGGAIRDPTITSIYFDNSQFALYNGKVARSARASSLRLRWYDHLSLGPEVFIEKKVVSDDDTIEESIFVTKAKYIQPFLKGDYNMDKEVQRLKDRVGEDSEEVKKLESDIEQLKKFVKSNDLEPVLRANYTRTAFQMPGDHRVRITMDTDVAMIREDALDTERPCRDPEDWHRRDIDDANMEYPFDKIRKGEISRFPYALLEIRTKGDKDYAWVKELMHSHLVKSTPRFSKFVQGVAQLFDDSVNQFPFWLSEVGTDIRRDPQDAFDEEQEMKAKAAEDEFAVGSLLRKPSSLPAFKASMKSPIGSPVSSHKPRTPTSRATADMTKRFAVKGKRTGRESIVEEEDSDDDDPAATAAATARTGFRQFLPFSTSKYAQARRHGQAKLPPGVVEPTYWIKDEGPVKVEAKVWLANQRTYIKWQHVSILLASLSLGLYNAAGEHNDVARALAVVYTVIALFTGLWGYGIYIYRARLIQARSGKDFDNVIGPAVVCVALTVALCLNFGFKYQAAKRDKHARGTAGDVAVLAGQVLGNASAAWADL